MSEAVYTPLSALRHPGHFLADAIPDLRGTLAASWVVFRSNVRARHRRSALGYVWLLLPAIATTLVWAYMHSRQIVSVGPTNLPYVVYVLSGMTLWQVFVDAVNAPLQQLTAGRQVITRSRVPHEVLLAAGVFEVVLNCVVRLVLLAATMALCHVSAGPHVALVPVGVAALTVLGLAVGVFAAPFGLLYDDVGRALAMVATFSFFVTPIVYRLPAHGALRFNPVTPLLETTRAWIAGGTAVAGFAPVAIVSSFLLIVAWLFQRLARPHVVARLG